MIPRSPKPWLEVLLASRAYANRSVFQLTSLGIKRKYVHISGEHITRHTAIDTVTTSTLTLCLSFTTSHLPITTFYTHEIALLSYFIQIFPSSQALVKDLRTVAVQDRN